MPSRFSLPKSTQSFYHVFPVLLEVSGYNENGLAPHVCPRSNLFKFEPCSLSSMTFGVYILASFLLPSLFLKYEFEIPMCWSFKKPIMLRSMTVFPNELLRHMCASLFLPRTKKRGKLQDVSHLRGQISLSKPENRSNYVLVLFKN
jgi:hypothetical protein